jgi:hypothetical protein
MEATTFAVHADEGVLGRNEERGHEACSAGVGVRRHTSGKVAEASASFEEPDEGEKLVRRRQHRGALPWIHASHSP